ncbi:hypothetical protein NECAME_03762 [Necator americanus]|uniref:Uncharacterized protein n=1 Tax=Necator americanus TaxID=51031 RepID=W2T052_NECAM|nr:hypothetical protein NECAME_03762 [Necator americanus]ETN75380.1 hypothetical protein NECAME_03762 [Necator americanus]
MPGLAERSSPPHTATAEFVSRRFDTSRLAGDTLRSIGRRLRTPSDGQISERAQIASDSN